MITINDYQLNPTIFQDKTSQVWNLPNNILLDPITDKGFKKSACGLLYVGQKDGQLFVEDQVSPEKEATGLLTEVFKNGRMVVETNLKEIRERIKTLKEINESNIYN